MAKSSKASTTDEGQEGSLLDFEFDEPQDFFGIKPDTLGSEKVIQQIKKARTGDDFDDETDDGTPTNLEDGKDKDKKGKGSTKGKKNEEVDEEIDDNFSDFGDKLRSSKEKETTTTASKKIEKKAEKVDEEIEDDEVDDENKEEKDKGKTKGKKEEEVNDNDIELEEDEEKVFGTLAKELEEKGIFSKVEGLDKEGRLSEDKFFEHFETELEARVDEQFEAFFKEMDEEGKAFLKYKRDGGDTRTFITQYGSALGLDEFDEEKPEHVNKVLIHYLRTYENIQDDEDFEDRLKFIKDSGKEKATAKRWYSNIAKDEKDRKEAVVKIQEKAALDRKENAKAFDDAIRDTIDKAEKIGSYTITKAEKKELDAYITKATVKVGGGRYIPELLSEIRRILAGNKKEDREDLILLAKSIKAKFKIPDGIVKDVNTAVVRRTRSKLLEAKNSTRLASSGQHSKKSMADYFEE